MNSAFEKYLPNTEAFSLSDHIIFGSHGPLNKKIISYDRFNPNANVFFSLDKFDSIVIFPFENSTEVKNNIASLAE